MFIWVFRGSFGFIFFFFFWGGGGGGGGVFFGFLGVIGVQTVKILVLTYAGRVFENLGKKFKVFK